MIFFFNSLTTTLLTSHLTSCWLWTRMLQLLADRTKSVQDVHHQTAPCFLGCIYSSSIPRFYFLRFQSACKLYKRHSKRNMEEDACRPLCRTEVSIQSHQLQRAKRETETGRSSSQMPPWCRHWRFCNVALGGELIMVSPHRAGFVCLPKDSGGHCPQYECKIHFRWKLFPILLLYSLVFRQEIDVILKFA